MEDLTVKVEEDIRCNFCHSKSSVFSVGDATLKCNQCHALYFPILLPGVEAERMVIQDWSIAYGDPAMGCKVVYGQKGDISRNDAETILQKDEELSPGFTKLSDEFLQRLWYTSDGTACIDEETIRDACRKFAYSFTGKDFGGPMSADEHAIESTVRVAFARKVAYRVDYKKLQKNHELILSIPKSNDRLIRYFIAEGQEKLIVIAAKKAFDSFMGSRKVNSLGAQLCKAICE